MTTAETVASITAILGLVVAALAAFRSAGSARAAQRWAEESAHTTATLAASTTAAEVLVEVQRVKSLASQAAMAYQTLEVFSGSYQNSGIREAISKANDLAQKAEAAAAPARIFGDAANKLSKVALSEVARVQITLTSAHAQVSAWRVELEQTVASVEAQNLQYHQRALQR